MSPDPQTPGREGPRAQRPLLLLVAAFAVCLSAGQTLVIRETMVALYGTEFSFSMVLGSWLVGVALGALAAGLLLHISRPRHWWLITAVVCYSAALPGVLVFVRLIRTLWDIGPGEFVPLTPALAGTAVATLPLGLVGGFIFPVTCRLLKNCTDEPAGEIVARIYVSDAAGAFVAGWLLAFLLIPHLNPFTIALLCLGLLWTSLSLFLLRATTRHAGASALLTSAFGAAFCISGLTLWGPRLQSRSQQRLWESQSTFRLIQVRNSRYQRLMLGKKEELFALYANGITVANFPTPFANPIEAALYLSQHPHPRRILWIGGGIEGAVQPILGWGIERLHLVQTDPAMIALTVNHLPETQRQTLRSPRLKVFARDALEVVNRAASAEPYLQPLDPMTAEPAKTDEMLGNYDLVVLNIGDPTALLANRFCTEDFYRRLRGIMNPGAVLALGPVQSAEAYVQGPVRRYLACHYHTLRSVFPDVLVRPGSEAVFFAALDRHVLSSDPEALRRRCLALGGIDEGVAAMVGYQFPPDRTHQLRRQLADTAAPINSGARPAAVVAYLRLWNRMTGAGPNSRNWFGLLTPRRLLWPALGAFLLVLLFARTLPARAPLLTSTFCVLTTGFVGMTAATLILFLYQSRFGFVYERVSLLVGFFMVGLCAGGVLARRLLGRWSRTQLLQLLATLETLQIVLMFSVALLLKPAWSPAVLFFAAQTAAGLLVGLLFPLANALSCRHAEQMSWHVAAMDAADHGGAVLGAFACGLLLMPYAGLLGTVAFIVLLKALSGFALILAYPTDRAHRLS